MSEDLDLNKRIDDFYKNLNRSYFIDGISKGFSVLNLPLPIGYKQTISRPSLVVRMTKALEPSKDSKVLEIGTGSGYQTVFLAEFASEVYTVERIEKFSKKAKRRLKKLGYNNIHYKIADGSIGWQEHAPYDRIIVTASAATIPEELLKQLALGGRLIIPVGKGISQELFLLEKSKRGKIKKKSLGPVKFVKLVGKYSS